MNCSIAGWISWALGFVVGAADFIPGLAGKVPCPPMAAFIVGAVLYFVLAKAGLESPVLSMESAPEAPAEPAAPVEPAPADASAEPEAPAEGE